MRNILQFLLLGLLTTNASGQQNSRQSSIICESYIGSSINTLSAAWGNKTNLWYDKDIDALVLVFAFDTSSIGYSFSTDHGVTWTTDTMLYHASSLTFNGRQPQGVIYNPAGNTNANNAFVTCFGATTDGATWNAHYEGTALMGSGANQQTIFPFSSTLETYVPQGGTIVKNTGVTWWSAAGSDGNTYNDTVVLTKGTFGGGNFSYIYTMLPVTVCIDNNGNKMFRNQSVIFDDSGQFGYTVVIGNDWVCSIDPSDSTIGLIVYKTADFGNTWYQIPSPQISSVDPLLQNNGSIYSVGTQLDLAIDQQGTLHVGVPVIPFKPGNFVDSFFVTSEWGLFDFSYSSINNNWSTCFIGSTDTYFGAYGVMAGPINPYVTEDNRLQLSRSWNGDKLFFTWFDTDTLIFGSASGNIFSDMHSKGVDVVTGLWTPEINFTASSGASFDGASYFGNVSYYTINDGMFEVIPASVNSFISPPISTGQPAGILYIGCASMDQPYSIQGSCITGVSLLGIKNQNSNILPVFYPNPSSGKTFADITLTNTSDVSIEITNTVGQVISSISYSNLPIGKNTLSIDCSNFSKGLYFYSIKAGDEKITKLMSVE